MQKLILILQLYPLIVKVVEANEMALPGPGQGAAKLGLVLQAIAAVFEELPELRNVMPLIELQRLVSKVVQVIVVAKNAAGVFRTAGAMAE